MKNKEEFFESDLSSFAEVEGKPRLFYILEQWRLLRFLFAIRRRNDQFASDSVTCTSKEGLEILANFIILVLGLVFLFVPMCLLNFVKGDAERLSIITGSAAIFTMLLWSATGQRPVEMLVIAAVYAAVLVVVSKQLHRSYRDLGPIGYFGASRRVCKDVRMI